MLMKSQPIQNKVILITRLSFLGIGNKTFPLRSRLQFFSGFTMIRAGKLPILQYNSSRIVLNYRYYCLVHYFHNCQLRVLVC